METVAEGTSGGPDLGLADRFVGEGCAAAIVASYAPGTTAEDRNMVFWKWGRTCPHRVTVCGPQGRPPKGR
jgi:RES domain-containing protein